MPRNWTTVPLRLGTSFCDGHTKTLVLVNSGSRMRVDMPKANWGGTTFVLSNVTTQLERSEKLRNICFGFGWGGSESATWSPMGSSY